MKIKTFIYVLIAPFLSSVQCQLYEVTQHQNGTSKNESKPLSARSPTECILKCRVKCMKSYFVENENQCYCLINQIEMPNSKEGVLYQENENTECDADQERYCEECIVGKTFKNCKDVQEKCPCCRKRSDFYLLQFDGFSASKGFCEM
uniref:Cnidarian restricted protein n=1 Tax=Clytia hemisphaerica TaxID=252671 RepID=A0A7M5VGU7_9CNID|eukprot:TCONS_00026507-protein